MPKLWPRILGAALVAPTLAVGVSSAGARRSARLLQARLSRVAGGPSTEASDAPAGVFGPVASREGPGFEITPRLEGFCEQRDGTPACTAPPCCCWSTFSGLTHDMYADHAAALAGRRCLNPPAGYSYAPQPGDVMDQGKLAQMEAAGFPIYEGRTLCCLVASGDLGKKSLRDPHIPLQTPQAPALDR
mmetsp:Transcript_78606/g.228157  ORF Transcript_78606/g.228157 Transcript_78606/m.228157 type:complete len:188 (-) Transcript_78606:98-661(-)